MMDGQAAAAQIQRAVEAAVAEVFAGHDAIEVPLAALRSAAEVLAQLTRGDLRMVQGEVAHEFCSRLSWQLRGIDDDRIGERMREFLGAVAETFPAMN